MASKLSDFLGTGYVACVDLEATCCNDDSFPRHEMEIIEFGCTIVDTRVSPYTTVARLDLFVRPTIHTKLTDFCKELTTIQQEDVDSADTWGAAQKVVHAFFKEHCAEVPTVWVSWGDFDRKKIETESFRANSNWKGPYPMPALHFNLKEVDAHQRNSRKQFGLSGRSSQLGLTFEGTLHRAGDDAAAVAKVLEAIAPGIVRSKV